MIRSPAARLAALLILGACGGASAPRASAQEPSQAPSTTPAATPSAKGRPSTSEQRALRGQAMAKAVPYLLNVDPVPIHLPLLLDVIRRRYGVTKFAGMTERYDAMLKEARGPKAARMRVLRRIVDHQNRINPRDLESIDLTSIDGITSRALYCDKVELPADYVSQLKNSITATDYGATHAALALMWMKENGCPSPLSSEEEQALVDRLASIPPTDGHLSDAGVEAATFLYCMGHGDRVSPEFIDLVVSSQREDGSWPYDSVQAGVKDTPHWHTSALALWLLLEVERGSKEPMLPH